MLQTVNDRFRRVDLTGPDEIRNDARVIAAYLGVEDEEEVEQIEKELEQ